MILTGRLLTMSSRIAINRAMSLSSIMSLLTEPDPVWPGAPRYCPDRPFPPYRFVPGFNPHPTGQQEGHSYGLPKKERAYLAPDYWQENENYLFGVDLYHQGFFWESHEVWEELWHLADKSGIEGQFLQGLIQNSAAQLKLHLKNQAGASHLSREAYRRLSHVINQFPSVDKVEFMGLDLTRFLEQMHRHYSPLWLGEKSVTAPAPHIDLRRR